MMNLEIGWMEVGKFDQLKVEWQEFKIIPVT